MCHLRAHVSIGLFRRRKARCLGNILQKFFPRRASLKRRFNAIYEAFHQQSYQLHTREWKLNVSSEGAAAGGGNIFRATWISAGGVLRSEADDLGAIKNTWNFILLRNVPSWGLVPEVAFWILTLPYFATVNCVAAIQSASEIVVRPQRSWILM